MSLFIEHAPCPDCGSKDNLAIYTDHEFCFGCGYIKFYTYSRHFNKQEPVLKTPVCLPTDVEPIIPAIADQWLQKYSLTPQELFRNRVVWSEYRQLLIFPYFDDKGFLWGWQGRYFGTDPKHPKWIGKGQFKDIEKIYTPLTSPERTDILIVEDIISTIKIQRLYNCTCIYGSFIDLNKYLSIYKKYKPSSFIIWLDKDKQKESYQYMLSFVKVGIPASVISTTLDPKEYSTEELRRIIEPQASNNSSLS